ncbi:hypothetical protein HDV63DRAFT_11007 [Trichoderma sp. SZMC 28014]
MCFSVEPKAKYYYQEEIIPARPHRESYRDGYRDSYRDSGVDYYHHHHRHSSSRHSHSHSPRASHTAVERYSSPRVSTYSPRISSSSTRRSVIPARVVYKETTQSRYV